MILYINSEKHLSNAEELTFNDILTMSGFPPNRNYSIFDENSNKKYSSNDTIQIHNNMSLMIQEG